MAIFNSYVKLPEGIGVQVANDFMEISWGQSMNHEDVHVR